LVYGRDGGACQPACLGEETEVLVRPHGGIMFLSNHQNHSLIVIVIVINIWFFDHDRVLFFWGSTST
jgi:hypothetical protein